MVFDRVVPVPSVYKVNRPDRLLAALIPTAIDRFVIIDIYIQPNRKFDAQYVGLSCLVVTRRAKMEAEADTQ